MAKTDPASAHDATSTGLAQHVAPANSNRVVTVRRPGDRHRASVLAATTAGRAPRMDMLTITHDRIVLAAEGGATAPRDVDVIRISGPYADVLAYIADSPDSVVGFDTVNGATASAELALS